MELRPIKPEALEAWRRKYRGQLGLPVIPDFHEAWCRMGQAYQVEEMGHSLGYAILTQETFLPAESPLLPEFYLDVGPAKYARQLLVEIIDRLKPRQVMGRTDDPSGFPLLLDLRLPNQAASALYLLDREPDWVEDAQTRIVESRLEDAQDLLSIYSSVAPEDGGIPDEMALMKSLALWRHYRLQAGREILAVAYVVPQTDRYVTVSPIVVAQARGKGYGRYLLAYVARREMAAGKAFVAAANADNEAGRGLLESLGARLAAHCMLFRP
ncbi:MAG: GNAT family N-acetyltransferase [candidate division FCPU426 bacterium]